MEEEYLASQMTMLPLAPAVPPRPSSFKRICMASVSALFTIGLAGACSYIQILWASLPVVNAESLKPQQTIRITDRRGREIYHVFTEEDRLVVPSENIPEVMRNAIIAIEDERFYGRPCIDPIALLRAVKANAEDYKSQGASTITQQLMRTAFLDREKTITRKLREILMACRLETQMEKDDILALYLNRVSFGHNWYGIGRASLQYFGVEAKDLTLAQAAVLAALPQRPSYYSPYGSHVRSTESEMGLIGQVLDTQSGSVLVDGRSDIVLKSMKRLGYISDEDFIQARRDLQTMEFRPRSSVPLQAPHFSLLVRDKVNAMMQSRGEEDAWPRAGLTVTTTLDLDLQKKAEQVIAELFPAIAKKAKAKNIALVAIDRKSRDVLAYVGSPEYFDESQKGKIDMARVPRQPGSSFKPLVYAAAFANGLNAKGTIDDTPLKIGTITPKNYDGSFKGRMTVRTALAWSRNLPAIRAFQFAGGEEPVLRLASAAGVTTPSKLKAGLTSAGNEFTFGWPMALGAAEVPLLEMVQAYATLGSSGAFVPMRTILSINDAEEAPVYLPPKVDVRQAIPAQAARDVAAILSDPNNRPAGFWRNALTIPGRSTTAKTGTSNVCFKRLKNGNCTQYGVNNTWTLGMSGDLVVGVWVGNADNTALDYKADGLTAAAPIWKAFLQRAVAAK